MSDMIRRFFDSHIHSCYSNDSQQTVVEICQSALVKGLQGVTITDHANMSIVEEDQTFRNIAASVVAARNARKIWAEKLNVFCGVEISEFFHDQHNTQRLLALADFDVVIASVHKVEFEQWTDFYSKINFDKFPVDKLYGFMRAYFESLLCMAEQAEYDVLAHLTCPLRYINGKHRRGISLEPHKDIIDEILRCLICRNKSLEINTSGINGIYENLMPDLWILQRYFSVGGRLITLASDAHTSDRIGNAFEEITQLLSKIGFRGYFHYEQRELQCIHF